MAVNPKSLSLRAKKLGILIMDARLASRRSIEECAQTINAPVEVFEAYELGEKSPSLPELEELADYLQVSIEHFWSNKTISGKNRYRSSVNRTQTIGLRQRKIGVLLKQARLEAGLSLSSLAEQTAIAETFLDAYELGDAPIPLPDLEALGNVLQRPIQEFRAKPALQQAQATLPRSAQGFLDLPPDLQAFVSKPINRSYLELAQRLSDMSADQLRTIAESILAITF